MLALLATLATMKAAIERGDVDEAARQGALAGPAVVEQALAAGDRPTVLAGIAAATLVTDRVELLPALGKVASSGDRRVAIPAATAARAIARELRELPDDVASDDVTAWRDAFLAIAIKPERFIDVRTRALDVAAALTHAIAPAQLGYDLPAALADRDPAFRLAAVELVVDPVPADARAPLATAIVKDPEPRVALAAAAVLCGDPTPPALDDATLARIRQLAAAPDASPAAARAAARCVATK